MPEAGYDLTIVPMKLFMALRKVYGLEEPITY
jgi:hypothetical protein